MRLFLEGFLLLLLAVVSRAAEDDECAFLRLRTRKALPTCCNRDHKPQNVLPLLVTCVGGAGSWQTSIALRKAGLLVEHERVGLDGAVSWMYAVRDSDQPYPAQGAAAAVSGRMREVRFRSVLQLVRCPVANIAALSTHKYSTLAFAARSVHVAIPPRSHAEEQNTAESHLQRSTRRVGSSGDMSRLNEEWLRSLARLWLRWNAHVERFADVLVRVEDSEDGAGLCAKVGLLSTNETCASSAGLLGVMSDAARVKAIRWSNWIFANGEYNPQRCLRGSCVHNTSASESGSSMIVKRGAAVHHRAHARLEWTPQFESILGPGLVAEIRDAALRMGYATDDPACHLGEQGSMAEPLRRRRRR